MELPPSDPKIFVLDFEGNGREGILEFGVIQLSDGELVHPVENFCHRRRPPSLLFHRRKIPDSYLLHALPLEVYFPFFQQLRREGILAAHHHDTENFLLRRTWPSPGFVPDWLSPDPGTLTTVWGPWLDTQLLSQHLQPHRRNHGLGELLRCHNLEMEWKERGKRLCRPDRCHPHCALYDAIGCAILLRHFLEKMRRTPRQLLLISLPSEQRRSHEQRELFPGSAFGESEDQL